jgi:hypothetical protein
MVANRAIFSFFAKYFFAKYFWRGRNQTQSLLADNHPAFCAAVGQWRRPCPVWGGRAALWAAKFNPTVIKLAEILTNGRDAAGRMAPNLNKAFIYFRYQGRDSQNGFSCEACQA